MIDRIVGKKIIGIKQCKKALLANMGIVLYVAKDADEKLISPIIKIANEKNIKVIEVNSMRELGAMSNISVNAAVALLLD